MNKPNRRKIITQKNWLDLQRKLDNLEWQLSFIRDNMQTRTKNYLRFDECVPPTSVCKDVVSMMDGMKTYTGFIGKLADYYGCAIMQAYVDINLDPKYNAVYYADRKTTYTKPTVSKSTILHEFFHHLVALHIVVCEKEDEEKKADVYARTFLVRAGEE